VSLGIGGTVVVAGCAMTALIGCVAFGTAGVALATGGMWASVQLAEEVWFERPDELLFNYEGH
jgi:hypothetical protein